MMIGAWVAFGVVSFACGAMWWYLYFCKRH